MSNFQTLLDSKNILNTLNFSKKIDNCNEYKVIQELTKLTKVFLTLKQNFTTCVFPDKWLENINTTMNVPLNFQLPLPNDVCDIIVRELYSKTDYGCTIQYLPENLYNIVLHYQNHSLLQRPNDVFGHLFQLLVEKDLNVPLWILTAVSKWIHPNCFLPTMKHNKNSTKNILSTIPLTTQYCFGLDVVHCTKRILSAIDIDHFVIVLTDTDFRSNHNGLNVTGYKLNRLMSLIAYRIAAQSCFKINENCRCGLKKNETYFKSFKEFYGPDFM